MKKKTLATVISQKEIAPGIFDMWLKTEIAQEAGAGQFIGVFSPDKSTLLPRPISICEVNKEEGSLRLVYRIAGKGTAEFSKSVAGDTLEVLGVLGNGYDLEVLQGKTVMLMGGGIGIPPMLELAKELFMQNEKLAAEGKPECKTEIIVVVGYRDAQTFLKEDLEKYGRVVIASEDGSVGTKGNVMNAVAEEGLKANAICSCGPMPMLRAIKKYAEEASIPAYISLEEHMACGVGACLGCVVKTKEIDHHSHVNNARICTDGPVFLASDVEI